jgi:hypothetical protein
VHAPCSEPVGDFCSGPAQSPRLAWRCAALPRCASLTDAVPRRTLLLLLARGRAGNSPGGEPPARTPFLRPAHAMLQHRRGPQRAAGRPNISRLTLRCRALDCRSTVVAGAQKPPTLMLSHRRCITGLMGAAPVRLCTAFAGPAASSRPFERPSDALSHDRRPWPSSVHAGIVLPCHTSWRGRH